MEDEPASAAHLTSGYPGLCNLPHYTSETLDGSFRTAMRELKAALGGVAHIQDAPGTIEQLSRSDEAPRTVAARSLEGSALAARVVHGSHLPGFVAFLDGVQQSRVVTYIDGAPIVHGTAGAVVRERIDRRLRTWAHRIEYRLYAAKRHLSADVWARLAPFSPTDSSAFAADEPAPSRHPLATLDRAMRMVQQHREDLEQRLAERWCIDGAGPVYIDGGISGSERVARARCAIGVVKSHRTFYAEGDELTVIFRLCQGERSTLFEIKPSRRTAVASYYLRLRDATGRDPSFGLVRVEIANDPSTDLQERADEVSRWLLAEATPLAMPDSRWDRMAYGIRDSEEFLRAIT